MAAKTQLERKRFFSGLLKALWDEIEDEEGSSTGPTYAADGKLVAPNPALKSLHVEGVGELGLPLSSNACEALPGVCEQASYGFHTNARQVDGSRLTLPSEFLSKTVYEIASKALHAMGLDAGALQVQVRLCKLVLYKAEGLSALHRDPMREPDMIATLLLQLPTQGGYDGGALVVCLGGGVKKFDFSAGSATEMFYSVFSADYEHGVQRVISGVRVCLSFSLVRGNKSIKQNTWEGLRAFSSRLARIEGALRPWLEAGNSLPEKLVIALKHKYSEKNFLFAKLQGEDRIVAQVLQNCRDADNNRWLDLHLCVVNKHQYGDGHSEVYWYEKSWTGVNNRKFHFHVEIKSRDELVIANGRKLFEVSMEPDETQEVEYCGEGSSQLYYRGVLAVWPKKMTRKIALSSRPSDALDILKRMAAEEEVDVDTLLQDLLSNLESNIAEINCSFRNGSFTSDLLQFCEKQLGLEGVLRALRILSMTFQKGDKDGVAVETIGVDGIYTATQIARAVQTYGWNSMASHVVELLQQVNVISQCESYFHLSLEIRKVGFYDAALMIAKRTLELAFTACLSWDEMRPEKIYVLAKLLFSFKECQEEWGSIFLERLEKVNVHFLHSLVVQIFAMAKHEVRQDSTLFTKICQIIISKDFHRGFTVTNQDVTGRTTKTQLNVVHMVRSFCSFGSDELVCELIQAFVDQSRLQRNQHLLKHLLTSDAVWKELAGRAHALQLLVNERVRVLVGKTEPVFSWRMPNAEFPHDELIEYFLMGPEEHHTYTEVYSLPEARRFISDSKLNGTYQNGFSAIGAEAGRGMGASVVIRKTRAAFDHQVALWFEARVEGRALKDRLRKIQDQAAASGSRPDANAPPQKRTRMQ